MEILEVENYLKTALKRKVSNFRVVSSDKSNKNGFFGITYDKGVQASIYIHILYAFVTGEMEFYEDDTNFNRKVDKILEKFFKEQIKYNLEAVLDDLGYSEEDLEDESIYDEVTDTLNSYMSDLEPLITLNIIEEDGEVKYYANFIEKTFGTDITIFLDSIEGTFDELSDVEMSHIIRDLVVSIF